MFFYVRGRGDAATLLRAIPDIVAGVDPTLPANSLAPLERIVSDNVGQDRLIALLSAVFAGLATVLAAIGVYAVLSYNIGGRTRELGLRLALGSSPGRLRAMVLKQVGWIAAWEPQSASSRRSASAGWPARCCSGSSGYDPLVFGGAVAVIAFVVLCASYAGAQGVESGSHGGLTLRVKDGDSSIFCPW